MATAWTTERDSESGYLEIQIFDCVGKFGYVLLLAFLVTAITDKKGAGVRDSLVAAFADTSAVVV